MTGPVSDDAIRETSSGPNGAADSRVAGTAIRDDSFDRPRYADTWDHLKDELGLLDLMIRLKVLQQWKSQPSTPLDQFKGLIIAESEVAALLAGLSARGDERVPARSDDSEVAELIEAIRGLESRIETRRRASLEAGAVLALDRLAELFQLTLFEQRCLIICLAVELDRRYEKLYAYIQDDVTRKKPTVDLVLNLLALNDQEKLTARHSFSSNSPLIRYQLIQVTDHYADGKAPLLLRSLKLDDRITDYLLGLFQVDSRLESIARCAPPKQGNTEQILDPEVQSRLERVVDRCLRQPFEARRSLIVYMHGPAGSGRRALVEQIAARQGLPVVTVDAQRMLEATVPFDELARLAGREAILTPAVLCFVNLDVLLSDERGAAKLDAVVATAAESAWLAFLVGKKSWRPAALPDACYFYDLLITLPDDERRMKVWECLAANGFDVAEGLDFGVLASKFRLSGGQISNALAAAEISSQSAPEAGPITLRDITAACRALSGQRLATLAKKIEPNYRWDDIVLPEDVLAQLREICSRVVHRHLVLGEWGFAKKLSLGKGVNALFAGPSGTGKTMASEIIANELELDLYKIDLSGVISKYIGETEKNLDRVFSAAEDANAILFFDEADALFGKRSEVRDSHDRYANIEISYLLQKMEEYEGLAILATNLRGNLDESFTRRLAFTIHFPFPDEGSRLRIWKGIWPAGIDLDEGADLEFLARRFKLSGGNIKNIALAAAFLAAEEGSLGVGMSHLIHATQREFQKMGKPLAESELGPRAVEKP